MLVGLGAVLVGVALVDLACDYRAGGGAWQLATVAASRQRHLTYPVLHYFHSADPESATAPSLARLSQALDLLRHGVASEHRPDPATLETLDRSISSFLETLTAAYIRPLDDPLPPVGLGDLRRRGVPTVSEGDYRDALAGASAEDRRRLLAGYLAEDGWWRP